VTDAVNTTLAADVPAPEPADQVVDPAEYRTSFFRWGAGAYLITTAALFTYCFTRTGGRIVYLIDDPAIHLTLAENLAHHGTWGVVPGTFQSASLSPLWTLLLSGFVGVASGLRAIGIPVSDQLGPLVLNVAAGLWVINLLASQQRVLLPSLRRPFDALGAVALAVYVLFLPGLTLLGMEHVLQIALVLSAVTLFQRKAQGQALGWPGWLPYLLVALATLVRFEDLFVVAGLVVGFVAMSVPGLAPATGVRPWRNQLKQATLVVVAAAVPFLAFVAFNKLMGQGLLPNSVLAKGQGVSGTEGNAFQARVILNRLTSDPMLGAMAVLVAGALVVGWRQQRRYTFPAIAFLVATGIHVTFAQVGWYERYQAYLIALGVLVLLAIADEVVPSTRRAPARAVLVPMLVLVALLLGVTKISLTTELRTAVQDTYQQRYQAGRFLGRYYDGEPVATGELGYISLEHDGPITDFLGLGDYEVLQARRRSHQRPGKEYWTQLAKDRGFKVAAVYPSTLLYDTPSEWILVGTWQMGHGTVTALERDFQFWATTPSEVRPLEAHLREFEKELPPGSSLTINPLAQYRADQLSRD